MATPVLPYPDMDFTPLDILTAAEMDQMVANDQYLRDFCAGLADGTNLSDGVIQARKINFDTIIPQSVNSEIDTGMKFDGEAIYAQRFNGSRSFSASTNLDIDLASGVDSPIKAIGWVRPGANLAKGTIGIATAGGTGSAINVSGGHCILVNSSNVMRLRFAYQTAGTMSYDIVCYYTKI